ncbi:papain cysteine protease family protein, partial [Polychytrium aggregatum]|uniref:papain cysteine protease family protein n=1 Tax=Polychytrium aggregatum TaxID=110093 RepID=UPI0022FDC798
DLRPFFQGPILDQGKVSSCTANAAAHTLRFSPVSEKNRSPIEISRLFLYYHARLTLGQTPPLSDNGCTSMATCETLADLGACPETMWPYDPTSVNIEPPSHCEGAAEHYITARLQYIPVPLDLDHIKSCLSSGHVIQAGMEVFGSFLTPQVAQTGMVPLPGANEQVQGGHAVVICGYTSDHFIMLNSWGESWGDKGYFHLPFEYLSYMFDFWTL